jgi:hypothetical protein
MKTIEKQSLILNCYVPNIILLSISVLSMGASGGLCYSVLSFRVVFCRLVFVLFLLAIEFSILLYTSSAWWLMTVLLHLVANDSIVTPGG